MAKKSPETIGRKKKLSVPELKFKLKAEKFRSLQEKKRVNSASFKKRPHQSAGKNKKYTMGKSPYGYHGLGDIWVQHKQLILLTFPNRPNRQELGRNLSIFEHSYRKSLRNQINRHGVSSSNYSTNRIS